MVKWSWSWSWSRSQKKEKVEPEPEPKLNNFSSPSLVQRAVQLIEVILPFSAQCYSAGFFSVCFINQLEVILNCVIQVAVIQRDLFRIFAFLPWLFLRCLTLYCCFYSYYYFFIIFCQQLFVKFYSAYRMSFIIYHRGYVTNEPLPGTSFSCRGVDQSGRLRHLFKNGSVSSCCCLLPEVLAAESSSLCSTYIE